MTDSTDRPTTQLLILTPVETARLTEPVVRAICGHDCVPSPQAQVALKHPGLKTTVICNREQCITDLADGRLEPGGAVGFDHP